MIEELNLNSIALVLSSPTGMTFHLRSRSINHKDFCPKTAWTVASIPTTLSGGRAGWDVSVGGCLSLCVGVALNWCLVQDVACLRPKLADVLQLNPLDALVSSIGGQSVCL